MRVMRLADSSESPKLVEASIPQPQPGSGEVLIRVAAAGTIRTELGWYPHTHLKSGEPRQNAIPAHEFAGTVVAIGEGVTDFALDEHIYGMNDWFAEGALAEYCLTTPNAIAPAPRTLTPTQAATVPISALTAWQGLFDRGHLQPGHRVLVHGAAGSVGLFAVQIAHLHGAHVTATASGHDTVFARELGAPQLIDYHSTRFEDVLHDPFNIIFDTVGGDMLLRSLPLLKTGGVAVTVSSTNENSTDERIKKAFFIVEPNQRQLMEIAALIDTYKLRSWVKAVLPLCQANDAYTTQIPGHGKVVVTVNPPAA
ncbi:NADP-dependent oxidoreductase [Edaphobacter aggregans]|uniref:NADP-dependent oxidoreductase n=1 Tax=Edaphobacter aggregans TaxID=570835 RepID=UPI000555DA20|nr:NADP-dependent oxidoreductase [Edaphobacter aggregans]